MPFNYKACDCDIKEAGNIFLSCYSNQFYSCNNDAAVQKIKDTIFYFTVCF